MSSHKNDPKDEDDIKKLPYTLPVDDEVSWDPGGAPTRGGFGNERGSGSSLPSSYSELHGDVRKGQKPRTERD